MLTHRFQSVAYLALLSSSRANKTPTAFSTTAFVQSSCRPLGSAIETNTFIRQRDTAHHLRSKPTFISYGQKNHQTKRYFNFFGLFGDDESQVPKIDKSELTKIIEDTAAKGRGKTGYVIIDVRNPDEVAQTGKFNKVVQNLPLPSISDGAFALSGDTFKDKFGFEKPGLEETIVLHCKGGIRSAKAVKMAQTAGYAKILDYSGGANDWFA
ncbi:hypothetical protein HJC23_002560 [Cyclotella cryptica]|uniref:Rhodanese domain-containing protein n=1 Tax=Cyclotella cryptica TaxID=29204 RepID=A0ABD3QZL4_9STRA|eukprot:CCRYP_001417-RA/>CCRYP_001417-RA protein AED:0.39 eAED:0.39 QI:0/-1/0/1/-1/1/1/0/210